MQQKQSSFTQAGSKMDLGRYRSMIPSFPMIGSSEKRSTRAVSWWIGVVLSTAAAGYFLYALNTHWSDFVRIGWTVRSLTLLLLLAVMYTSGYLLSGYIWYLLLRGTGERPSYISTLSIYSISQFAKYIPGNVGHFISRIGLAASSGMKVSNVTLTVLIETAWSIGTAILIGLGGIFLVGVYQDLVDISFGFGAGKLLAIVAVVVLIPFAGRYAIDFLILRFSDKNDPSDRTRIPSLYTLTVCFLLFTSIFVLLGVITDVAAQQMFGVPSGNFLLFTSCFTIAWVVGLVVPGAPGGVGVREAVLLSLLSPEFGAAISVGIATVLRIITLLGDFLAFVFGYALKRH